MGWWFSHESRDALVKERTEQETWEANGVQHSLKTVAHKVVGDILWQVVEHSSGTNPPKRYIICNLMKKDGKLWGYKDISEQAGPFYYSCPLSFLRMVPVADAEWRAKVRQFHAEGRKFDIVN